MTKPTTTEDICEALAQFYEHDYADEYGALVQAAAKLRELERENAEARKLAEEWRRRAHNPPGGQTFVYQDVLFPWEEA